ncbi:MAG: CotH kinase family protein, partial [Clostridiales bacterium]|nr:CotH kinase family protein [Clostridiales bacterium]
MKKTASFLLFLSVILSFACASANPFTVRRADGAGAEVSSLKVASGSWYLFLPAYMKGQSLSLSCGDKLTLRVNEKSFHSGDEVSLTPGDEVYALQGNYYNQINVMASTLPALHLTTTDRDFTLVQQDKDNKVPAKLTAVTPEGMTLFDADLKNLKGHGNATFAFKKKSYQIQFKKKTDILGLPAQKKFILLANQHENSLLRNRITFDLARAAGLRYTPECKSVDLYVNGEYLGSYLLCNKVTVSSGSVNITDADSLIEEANPELAERGVIPEAYGARRAKAGNYKGVNWPAEPEDVTGGFLLQLDYDKRYVDDESGVVTKRGQTIVVKSPEYMTKAQGEYLNALLNTFERAIFAQDGVDPNTGRRYTDIADLDSLVRKYMIEEICKNYDGNNSSQFYYKDSDLVDPLLYAGPVWDYDSAWGNYAGEGRLDIAAPQDLRAGGSMTQHAWWPAMVRKADFREAVSQNWRAVYRPMLLVLTGDLAPWDGCGVRPLSELGEELSASAAMNFKRWNIFNAVNRAVKTGATYEENIAFLTYWIRDRVA